MQVTRVAENPRHQRGVALIVVLWVVALLTVIVSSFVYSARGHVRLMGNLTTRSEAGALADAGVYRGMYELFKSPTDGARWMPDGRPYEFQLSAGKITVSMLDEAAYIDLNVAPEKLLSGLLVSIGVAEDQAAILVDAILDWRDPDDLTRPSGAERDEYLAAGRDYGPANARFRTVDELKRVLGVTPELYDKIAGALTVYSNSAAINTVLAPRQVLLAIPNVSPGEVDAYLAARQEELTAGLTPAPFAPAAGYSGGKTAVYNIRSISVLPDGARFVREAVVRLNRDPKRPWVFLDWREGRP